MSNYKAPLIAALGAAGFSKTDGFGFARMTFTQLRKNGTRRVKLWYARDVFDATRRQQLRLERELKASYGDCYLGGYFIVGGRQGLMGERAFCIVLKEQA
jgi:hypothetical protein